MWKNISSSLKSTESYISMALGIIVVVLVGMLAFNFLGPKTDKGKVSEQAAKTENQSERKEAVLVNVVPTIHKVKRGETLWMIAERYYHSGYNWITIAKANNLSDPGIIHSDLELKIPDADVIIPAPEEEITETPAVIEPQSYTVVKGDTLWKIAVKSYGDGFAWTRIAKANNLSDPGLIHPGNVLTLPR